MRFNLLRRTIHTFGSISIVYYFIPLHLRNPILVVSLLAVALVEILRVKGKIRLMGMRDYEKERPSGFFFFAVGASVLLIFFPKHIVIPSILCASFADPLVGELRKVLGKEISYVIMFLFSFFIFYMLSCNSPYCLFVSVAGAAAVVLGETVKIKYLDDNLLIQLLPAFSIYGFYLLFNL